MRNLHLLAVYRRTDRHVVHVYGSVGDHQTGVFELASLVDKAVLRVIATSGDGWDHVSVSRENRCPDWTEMEYVKRLFFKENETAMQLHVPPADHINVHPHCLHLWRPLDVPIPMPPKEFVG